MDIGDRHRDYKVKRARMFKSYEEFWQTVNEFIAELEVSGHSPAADELKNGMRAVTGLTDGWADFLESIEKVKKQHSSKLDSSQRATLKNIHRAVYQRVYCTSLTSVVYW